MERWKSASLQCRCRGKRCCKLRKPCPDGLVKSPIADLGSVSAAWVMGSLPLEGAPTHEDRWGQAIASRQIQMSPRSCVVQA